MPPISSCCAPRLQLLCPTSPAAVPSSWPCSQHGWHEQKGGNEAKLSKYFQLGVALGSPCPPPPIFTLPVAPLAMAGSSGQHSKGIPVTLCQGMKPSQEQGGAGTAGLVCDPQCHCGICWVRDPLVTQAAPVWSRRRRRPGRSWPRSAGTKAAGRSSSCARGG